MEQTNYQEPNLKMFSDHIHDPSAIAAEHSEALESLTVQYPYSQLLRSFYARSLVEADPSIFEKELTMAALCSPDRGVLRTIIENAEHLKSTVADEIQVTEGSLTPGDIDTVVAQGENISIVEQLEIASDEPETDEDVQIIDPVIEADPAEDQNSILKEPELTFDETAGHISSPQEQQDPPAEDDGLDLHLKQHDAGGDYSSESIFKPEILENSSPEVLQGDQQKVSRYNDDKLPYSFLWWLSRTRKEHSENYQPYLSFHLDTSQSIRRHTVDQLSSQIIENIFHLQSPIDELKDAPRTVPFQVKRKEDYILEKFIREEPQIKAPNSEKLDNENKARKSAEDPNDLVSETLANIYTDQMLFHKAIDTYKKLSLKFPEKSTYFADQIRELEKKIN